MNRLLLVVISPFLILLPACTNPETAEETANAAEHVHVAGAEAAWSAFETRAASLPRDAGNEQWLRARTELAEELLAQLPKDEQPSLALARLQHAAGNTEAALASANRVAASGGEQARQASVLTMQFLANLERYDELQQAARTHAEKYQPDAADPEGMYAPLRKLVAHLATTNRHDEAVALIENRLQQLPTDFPFDEFNLLMYADGLYRESGRLEAFEQRVETLLQQFRKDHAALLEKKQGSGLSQAEREAEGRYANLLRRLGNALQRVRLTGQSPPDFSVTQVMNGDTTTLEELRGNVVLLEFWTNWCSDCKASFPHLQQLKERYGAGGLKIIGITSLQGYFIDGDIREDQLEPEREYALTEAMLPRHGITWPVWFIEESVLNRDWGVNGVPTLVVLDRQGRIHLVQNGTSPEAREAVDRTVASLFSE